MQEIRVHSKKYGWRPDKPDHRDLTFKLVRKLGVLPEKVDLRPNMPPVYDQGDLGSCTGNALAACFEAAQMKQKVPYWTPSRLMIYYLERFLEHTIKEDAGAEIRDGAKVLARYGVCPENVWPYDVSKFAVKPPKGAFKLATQSQALRYARLRQTESDVCQTLAQGFPIAFGFMVYEEINLPIVAQKGDLPMPGKRSTSEGGHAVTLVGYDLTTRKFLVRNSWGTGWGIGGYFWMPFDYVLSSNLSDDFWVLYSVEDGDTVDGE